MQDHSPRAAPDHANAALIMGFVNLLWSLLLIWANFGLPAVLAVAVFLNYLITHLADHRARLGYSADPPLFLGKNTHIPPPPARAAGRNQAQYLALKPNPALTQP